MQPGVGGQGGLHKGSRNVCISVCVSFTYSETHSRSLVHRDLGSGSQERFLSRRVR